MVLQNNIILQTGVPARMHFFDHHIEARDITDPKTGRPTVRNALVFESDMLDGRPVRAIFSTLAEKLASALGPYLEGKRYTAYEFIITKTGVDFRTSYAVTAIPRA